MKTNRIPMKNHQHSIRPGLVFILSCAAALAAQAGIDGRPAPADPDAIRVVTANIHQLLGGNSGASVTEDDWEHRKDICRDVLAAQKADIFCFQECRQVQLDHFLQVMPGFACYSLKAGTQPPHPGNAIMYSAERFERLAADGFWLSETPRVPRSISWGSDGVRFANWVQLKDKKTGRAFVVWSLHLDQLSQLARVNQVGVVLESAAVQEADVPQLLLGDFNAGPGNEVYGLVMGAGWTDTYVAGGGAGAPNPGRTAHAFTVPAAAGGNKLDFIFSRGKFSTIRTEIIKDFRTVDGADRYPSDHYFVSADMVFDTSGGAIPEPESYTPVSYHEFGAPAGIALDAAGDVYVADEGLQVIKKVSGLGAGAVRTAVFAGIPGGPGLLDSADGARALFNQPRSLALQDGIWYVADSGNKALRVIDADTTAVSLYAGTPYGGGAPADGDLASARFGRPAAVAVAADGAIYIADAAAHAIRRIDAGGTVDTLAGAPGVSGTAGGAGRDARFNEPAGIALDEAGRTLYVADAGNHAIRRIALGPDPVQVDTIAGRVGVTGWADGAGDGALFSSPCGVAMGSGTLFVADTGNHIIRAITLATGAVARIAGTPGREPPLGMAVVRDGAGDAALFSYPSGVAVDAAGNLYVADTGNGTIRYINFAEGGAVSTPLALSGSGGPSGPDPDPGPGPSPNPPGGGGGGGVLSPVALLALALLAACRRRTFSRGG
jgi:endonuclease/exonuclease/phosphatase family metal-dependent hydrolase/sugar lactone lactonase YvrE